MISMGERVGKVILFGIATEIVASGGRE